MSLSDALPSIADADMAELRRLRATPDAMRAHAKTLGLKLRDRLRLENHLLKAPAADDAQSPPPPKRRPQRVCMVTTANAFIYDDSPSKLLPASEQGGNMRIRPTGGLTLTYALVRHVKKVYGAEQCSIIALDYVFHDAPPTIAYWEGHAIVRAPAAQMAAFLGSISLGGKAGLAPWDVVIAANLSSEVIGFVNANLGSAGLKVAMCHDYAGAPFGPFTSVPADAQAELAVKLGQRWALLCDSAHTAGYMERHAKREGVPLLASRRCYGATYDYYDVSGSALPPRLSETHASAMRYCTIISPCVPKGLSILLRVTSMLPHVPFAACCTSWTNDVTIKVLKQIPNLTLLDSSPRVDDIFEQTRVLLAPSIWAEAFGLVATEACARGIPCVSSGHGGLSEANTLSTTPEFEACAVPTTLVHDHHYVLVRRGTSLAAVEEELAHERAAAGIANIAAAHGTNSLAATGKAASGAELKAQAQRLIATFTTVATEEEAQPYADLISRLMDDDAFYARASDAARASGVDFIRSHRGRFAEIVEQLWDEFGKPADSDGSAPSAASWGWTPSPLMPHAKAAAAAGGRIDMMSMLDVL